MTAEPSFSHLIFWHHPLQTLCFFAFAMGFVSLWIKRHPWVWGSFALIATVLALQTGLSSWLALLPIVLLGLFHYSFHKKSHKGTRFTLLCLITALSCALILHLFPGFHNWHIATDIRLTPDAAPYNLWLNFDKPWIGLFPLALTIPLLQTRGSWLQMLKVGLPLSLIGIGILIGLSVTSGVVRWEPKIPALLFVWVIDNLLFVSIPEEAFFRGFIQREIGHWFEGKLWGPVVSISATSLLFTLLHIHWVADLTFLGFVFLASLIYGTVYQVTRSIEASILCHFGLNLTHFLFFTYPLLA